MYVIHDIFPAIMGTQSLCTPGSGLPISSMTKHRGHLEKRLQVHRIDRCPIWSSPALCLHQATGGELYSRIAQSCARLTGRTSGLPENQRCTVGATVVRRGIVIVWVGC